MTGLYWTAEDDRVPANAVLVCVLDGTSAGREAKPGTVLARVQWVMAAPEEDMLIARSEGPFEMGTALDYAEEIAELYGFSRVMVAIGDRAAWQVEWGTLSPPSGPH